jgi:cold shock CspA family protein
MFTGTIISAPGRGVCWCEQDATHTSTFVHISQVADRRVLHVDDRIRFDIAPNPARPGQVMAVNVTWIGRVVARQTSASVSGGAR